jgi:hypothetical protein
VRSTDSLSGYDKLVTEGVVASTVPLHAMAATTIVTTALYLIERPFYLAGEE